MFPWVTGGIDDLPSDEAGKAAGKIDLWSEDLILSMFKVNILFSSPCSIKNLFIFLKEHAPSIIQNILYYILICMWPVRVRVRIISLSSTLDSSLNWESSEQACWVDLCIIFYCNYACHTEFTTLAVTCISRSSFSILRRKHRMNKKITKNFALIEINSIPIYQV